MDSLFKKEEFILLETVATGAGSFVYELHYNKYFNKVKLSNLLRECEELSGLYALQGKSSRYPDVVRGVTMTFQHVLFLVSCHFMEDDNFIIQNYKSDLSSEIISDYYVEFRYISKLLIM